MCQNQRQIAPYAEAFSEYLQVTEEIIKVGKSIEVTALRVKYETFLQKYEITSYKVKKLKVSFIN